jgi:hypothetical protein
MKRRAKRYYVRWETYNALHDIDREKLKLIGAIAMTWNFIEDMVDDALAITVLLIGSALDLIEGIIALDRNILSPFEHQAMLRGALCIRKPARMVSSGVGSSGLGNGPPIGERR